MVLEKMISLYEAHLESLYPPWWMSFNCFSTIDYGGKTFSPRWSGCEFKRRTLPDSPNPNINILISFFAVSLSLFSWLSISSLPRVEEAMISGAPQHGYEHGEDKGWPLLEIREVAD